MAERAFVIGLSGIPGAGKSTLTQLFLRDFKQLQVVYYDRFQTINNMTHDQVRDWFARGADPNEFALIELTAELQRRSQIQPGSQSCPVVLFETPFGRLHRTTGAFIDFLIWIDTPLDVALGRAILTFLNIARRDRAPNAAAEFIQWQTQYMLNYPLIRPMYISQRERIMADADVILNGLKPAEESAALVRKALAERNVAI